MVRCACSPAFCAASTSFSIVSTPDSSSAYVYAGLRRKSQSISSSSTRSATSCSPASFASAYVHAPPSPKLDAIGWYRIPWRLVTLAVV